MPTFQLGLHPKSNIILSLYHYGKFVQHAAKFKWCVMCDECGKQHAAPGLTKCYFHLGPKGPAHTKSEIARGYVSWLCLQRALSEPIESRYEPALLDLKLRLGTVLQDPDPAFKIRRPKQHTLQRVLDWCPTVVQDTFDSDTLTGLTRARLCAYVILRVEAGLLYGQTGRPQTREKAQTDGRFDVIAIAEQAAASSARAERYSARRANNASDDHAWAQPVDSEDRRH